MSELPQVRFSVSYEMLKVVVTCHECNEKIGLAMNSLTTNQLNKMIVKFRKDHEKAHRGGSDGAIK